MNRYNPLTRATETVIKSLDHVEEINNSIIHLKSLIREYFSDNLQMDENPTGAMRRLQIRKELLEFANK